jgi:hypothetical protein
VGADPRGEDLRRAISFLPIQWLFLRAMEFEKAYHAVPETPPFSWPQADVAGGHSVNADEQVMNRSALSTSWDIASC